MINRKAIGYITANYSSTYGSVLLKDRPIASVPFLGRYRLIDFPLSNMMNAGIKTVGVVMPGNYRSLIDHVGSGKDWGLDRKKGGLFMVPGNAYGTTKGGMRFLLRDIISNKTLFQRSDKPYVVMMGTNIIFNMDLNTIIEAHENSGAQMTVVYCKATRNVDDETKLEINENGRLTGVSAGVVYGDNASMDCCIVNRETLLEIIDHYQAADYLDLLEALQGDFGNIDVCSYEYKGEVVGVFSEKSLYRRSMDLLDQTVADQLFDPERPILTKAHDVPPSRYATGSHACNSIISAGCIIKGTVRNSILSRGVVPGSSFSVSFSAMTATLTSLTPGSRSTAVRIFTAQDAQSIPVTTHSCDSASDFCAISSLSHRSLGTGCNCSGSSVISLVTRGARTKHAHHRKTERCRRGQSADHPLL